LNRNKDVGSIYSIAEQKVPTQLFLQAAINNGPLMKFMVDTGASYSCLPLTFSATCLLEKTNILVSSCSGQNMRVAGEVSVELAVPSLRRCYESTFVVCDVTMPILGMDFLKQYAVRIDCGNRTIIDPITGLSATLSLDTADPRCCELKFDIPIPEGLKALFEECFSGLQSATSPEVELPVQHYIDIGSAPPPHVKCRRLHGEKLEAAKIEIDRLLKLGVIRPSSSPYSSPIHMVRKPGGGWRLTGDYRMLNSVTVPDRYPIPHLFSFQEKLKGMKVFSKIDLVRGFHHVRVNPKDVEKTAIITPFGLFEHVFMPMGLRNSPATFQRLMDRILKPCELFCFWFIDDLIIFSPDTKTHRKHLRKVFRILAQYGLTINLSKSLFEVSELPFLGHEVDEHGIKPSKEKLKVIQDFPLPIDYSGLRRYMGMIGFFRRMIPHFSDRTILLSEMLKNQPNSKCLTWTEESRAQFEETKKMLCEAVRIPHPSSTSNIYHLVSDASQFAIGGALYQLVDGEACPVGFFSKKLSETQRAYSTFDRELLALYETVLYFKDVISGQLVDGFTDHKPIVSCFKSKNAGKTDRQQRHLTVVTEYLRDLHYVKGSDNVLSDALSRISIPSTGLALDVEDHQPMVNAVHVDLFDFPTLAEAQSSDPEIQEFISRLQTFSLPSGKTLYCDTSSFAPRPFVVKQFRPVVFKELHDIAHPGVKGSLRLIKSRYFWPDMNRDIRNMVRSCATCQKTKINRHTKSSVSSDFILPVSSRFAYVHLDLVGPLPLVCASDGVYYRYLLTIIDRATRWIEAVPLVDISARNVALAFLNCWISRFGVPLYCCTDQGRQFESELFSYLSHVLGFTRLRTTAYNPKCNGMIERAHRTLKTALKGKENDWLSALPVILMGLRAQPNSDSGCSPFALVTGTNMLVPILTTGSNDPNNFLVDANVQSVVRAMQSIDFSTLSLGNHHSSSKTYVPSELKNCEYVWLRIDRVLRPLEAPYQGPYKVIARRDKTFDIQTLSGSVKTVSIDRLKPVFTLRQSAHVDDIPNSANSAVDVLEPHVAETQIDLHNSQVDATQSEVDVTESRVDDVSCNAETDVTSRGIFSRCRPGKRQVTFRHDPDFHYF
jgi:cleavage and polyadenylation specificity factor subunit 1